MNTIFDSDERKYNAENIRPIESASVRLNLDLHRQMSAPKRPRLDPFSSIYAKLESTRDDDFNVGIKSIKVRDFLLKIDFYILSSSFFFIEKLFKFSCGFFTKSTRFEKIK